MWWIISWDLKRQLTAGRVISTLTYLICYAMKMRCIGALSSLFKLTVTLDI